MGFENINQPCEPEPASNEKADSAPFMKRLKRLAQVLAASSVAVGAVGCDAHSEKAAAQPHKPDRLEKASELFMGNEIVESSASLDQVKLASYHKSMKEGNFGVGFKELSKARAIDLAMKKGFKTGFNDMTIQSSTGVPVEIIINGQHVPVLTRLHFPQLSHNEREASC